VGVCVCSFRIICTVLILIWIDTPTKKDIEICAVKLHILSHTIIKITVYRSPTVNIAYIINNLKAALNQVHNNTVDIILCGDFNINYFNDNQNKQAVNSLLPTYRIYSIIDLATRFQNISHTMVDKIYIYKFKNENYSVYSLINSLSYHNAQILSLSTIILPDYRNEIYAHMKISKHSLNKFQTCLNYEAWENVLSNNDNNTNTNFNNFLNTSLGKFYTSFPKKIEQNLCRILKPG